MFPKYTNLFADCLYVCVFFLMMSQSPSVVLYNCIYYFLFTNPWLLIVFYVFYTAVKFQLKTSLYHQQQIIAGLKKELATLTDTLHQTKKDLNTKNSIIEVFYKEEEIANNTMDDLKLKLETMTNDHNAMRHRLIRSCEFVVDKLEHVNLPNRSNEMKWKIKVINYDLHELLYSKNGENRENENSFDILEKSIDVLVDAIQHHQKASIECEFLRTNLIREQGKKQELRKTVAMNNRKITEYQHLCYMLQNMVARRDGTNEIATLTDTLHQTKKDLDIKNTIIEVFYKEVEIANSTIDDLKLKLETMTNDHNAMRHNLMSASMSNELTGGDSAHHEASNICGIWGRSHQPLVLLMRTLARSYHSNEIMKCQIEAINCNYEESVHLSENRQLPRIFSDVGTQTKSVRNLKPGQCGVPGTSDMEDALEKLSQFSAKDK